MEKQIIIDYSEYKSMLKVIDDQQKAIEDFKKGESVVLIDDRHQWRSPRRDWYTGYVPKIIVGPTLSKEYLQEEFDQLSDQFIRINQEHNKLLNELNSQKRKSFWG